jgi:hypothetical protein
MSRKPRQHSTASANDEGRSGCFGRFMNPAVSAHATRSRTNSPKTPVLAGWLFPGAFPTSPVLEGAIRWCKHSAYSRSMRNDASRNESSCIASEKEKRDEVSVRAEKMFDCSSTIVQCDVVSRTCGYGSGCTEILFANIGNDAGRARLRAHNRRAFHRGSIVGAGAENAVVRQPFVIGGLSVKPGERRLVDLPISKLSYHAPVALPVHVLHGSQPGPTMFVCAAIHGDELNGVEIIRRLLRTLDPKSIGGTLLCVPVVNVFGFISRSRYLPDRRDLNRSFPGSATGSLAARLAHLFLSELVKRSQIGIDLHTAAIHRINLPQVRCVFRKRPRCLELGVAFGAEVMLESRSAPARCARPRARRASTR